MHSCQNMQQAFTLKMTHSAFKILTTHLLNIVFSVPFVVHIYIKGNIRYMPEYKPSKVDIGLRL